MQKLIILMACTLGLTNTSVGQTSFTWSPNDTIIQDVDPNLYTELDIHQINVSGDTLELGIEVVYNDIPSTWDGMICIQGLCLGSIHPAGFTEIMIPIYDSIYGYTKLTVFPQGGTESGILRIRVYDVNNPTDDGICTWIVNSVAPTDISEIKTGLLRIFPNPASDRIQVSSEIPLDELRISDLQGRMVSQEAFVPGGEHTIDLGEIPSGVYLVEILAEEEVISQQKLVVHD